VVLKGCHLHQQSGSASQWNLLEMQILCSHLRLTKSETLGVGPVICILISPSCDSETLIQRISDICWYLRMPFLSAASSKLLVLYLNSIPMYCSFENILRNTIRINMELIFLQFFPHKLDSWYFLSNARTQNILHIF
jgi:hypothetical protein